MLLLLLPMHLEGGCTAEVLEVQLAEEAVEVGEEMAQLAALLVVVVAQAMEQSCEELYGTDVELEQLMQAMQLPVLPMNLAEKKVVQEPDVDIVEQTLQAEQQAVQLT